MPASAVVAGACALMLLVVSVAWWLASRGAGEDIVGPIIRSSVLPPPHTSFVPSGFSLSQDGTRLAFVAETTEGSRMLWIRSMSTTTAATAVLGTDGAMLPFWSPDQRRVGFFADRKLKVVEVGSGAIQVLADAPRASGGTWGAPMSSCSRRTSMGHSTESTRLAACRRRSATCRTARVPTVTAGQCFCLTVAASSMSP